MSENGYEIIGLAGFFIAGLIFIAAGINAGDMLTVVGSAVWALSCVVWMVPLVKSKKN